MTKTQNILLDLIRLNLSKDNEVNNLPLINSEEWREIFTLASQQGVFSLLFDAVASITPQRQPKSNIMLNGAANRIILAQRHCRNGDIVKRLNETLNKSNIEMILLKGWGLSTLYPNPSTREFGDIDIYTKDPKEVDSLLGACTKGNPKHSVIRIEGVVIENHYTIVDQIEESDIFAKVRRSAFLKVEEELKSILRDEGTVSIEGIKTPSATFNFIYLIIHAGSHLGGELVVRHICDWYFFLINNKGKYDEQKVEEILSLLNFKEIGWLMTEAAIDKLGLPREYAPSFYQQKLSAKKNQRFINSLFFRFPNSKQVKSNNIIWKLRRFHSKQWRNKMLYDLSIYESAYRTLIKWYNSL